MENGRDTWMTNSKIKYCTLKKKKKLVGCVIFNISSAVFNSVIYFTMTGVCHLGKKKQENIHEMIEKIIVRWR